jgi:hypothetical protein
MEISVGTRIRYTSAAGTRTATVRNINVGPTAKPGFDNTWMTLDIPVQEGQKFATAVRIPADNTSLLAFQVQVVSAG